MKQAKNMLSIPTIPVRGIVIFPKILSGIEVARATSLAAIQKSLDTDHKIFLVTQKNTSDLQPLQDDLYEIGTVAQIKQCIKIENEVRMMVVGLYRARLTDLIRKTPYYLSEVKRMTERRYASQEHIEVEAAKRTIKSMLIEFSAVSKRPAQDVLESIYLIEDPLQFFYMVCTHVPMDLEKKQRMLEENQLLNRLHMLMDALKEEISVANIQREFFNKVELKMDKNQREYFLREQAKVINEELGIDSPGNGVEEAKKYMEKIEAIVHIAPEAKEKLLTEAKRLQKMPDGSHEGYVSANYLDAVLRLPWDDMTEESIDLNQAQKQLDSDHYGLKKVKERILEYLAVRILKPNIKGQIICLVGPPGVGKTSVGRSVAKALSKKFVRISLGGISDESEIRGHRKTYIGAMPGKIMAALTQAKSRNPVILLDEIDKLGNSFKGDPSSAMLEVLDPEQNHTFVDHYIDVPFDLSDCLFITTANTQATIPAPLLDRMEVIELSSYTLQEKFHICKDYLIAKQLKKHGLTEKQFKIDDTAIYALIEHYTKEAGVRNLERTVAALCRKAARLITQQGRKSLHITVKNLEKYLGPFRYLNEKPSQKPCVGLVNGLAYTSVGGELLQIEASVMEGKGKLQLTGNLGDVMKESAKTAISYVRTIAERYRIPSDFYEKKDIHIHLPEGAVPKDGPSAGVALATVLVSALANIPIRQDVAMTGEITLRGRDLPIGGLKEKSIAAYKSDIKTVLIPKENQRDLVQIDEEVRKSMRFIPCETVDEVLSFALVRRDKASHYQSKAMKKKSRGEFAEGSARV